MTNLKRIIYEVQFKRIMEKKGYQYFSDAPYDVNFIGIRSRDETPDVFNDLLVLEYRDYVGELQTKTFTATTDPGLYYLLNPINLKGTAILKPGQYRGVFKIGEHRGLPALVQNKEITVIRDFNRDSRLDFDQRTEETGWFGIHVHRAWEKGSVKVGKWSAGCQVIADPVEFEIFLRIMEEARVIHGNAFTYTLLEEKDLGLRGSG